MRASSELAVLVEHLACAVGLPGRSARRPARFSWGRWLALVEENQLGPLFGARVPRDPALTGAIPYEVRMRLRAQHVRASHDAAFRSPELLRLVAAMEGVGRTVALKGAALAHHLYSDASEREMSDFDLFFLDARHLEQARALLLSEGYAPRGGERHGAPQLGHHEVPLTNGRTQLTFELHHDLGTPGLPRSALEALFAARRRLRFGRLELPVLDPVGACVHHALHALADPIDSPLLRNLFEVGWLAERLTPSERAALVDFAHRFDLASRVAPALGLASRLFHTPALFDPAPLGAREWWARWRMEQTGSLDASGPRRGLFLRDVARRHLRAIGLDPGLGVGAFVGALVSAIGAGLSTRLSRPKVPQRVAAVDLETGVVGDSLIAHDPETGAVHLLSALATTVWVATETEVEPERLAALLETRGIAREVTREAVDCLLAQGLLRPVPGRA